MPDPPHLAVADRRPVSTPDLLDAQHAPVIASSFDGTIGCVAAQLADGGTDVGRTGEQTVLRTPRGPGAVATGSGESAARARPQHGRWAGALSRAAAPLAVAAVAWMLGRARVAAVAALAGAGLFALGVIAPSAARAVDARVARGAELVARAVGRAMSFAAWLLIVMPVWMISRVLRPGSRRLGSDRSQPAWSPAAASGAFTFRRSFGAPHRPEPRGSLVVRAMCLLLAALLGAGSAVLLWPERTVEQEQAAPVVLRPQVFEPEAQERVLAYAFADEPWAEQAIEDAGKMIGEPDPVLGWRGLDRSTTHVNVVDGRRVSYEPEDPVSTVWFFGGSTMFGDGQRDEHTIPSVVARLSEADGRPIRAVNFGVGSYNNYQETMAFVEALALEEPPDLAVFYDGANEWSTALERINYGVLDPDRTYYQAANEAQRAERQERAPELRLDERQQMELFVELGAAQYRRGAELARSIGAAHGVEVVHFWQPGLWSTPVRPFTAELLDMWQFPPEAMADLGESMSRMRERSGVDPIDLSDALADVERPTFYDPAHTNEFGARLIAADMYGHLRTALDAT